MRINRYAGAPIFAKLLDSRGKPQGRGSRGARCNGPRNLQSLKPPHKHLRTGAGTPGNTLPFDRLNLCRLIRTRSVAHRPGRLLRLDGFDRLWAAYQVSKQIQAQFWHSERLIRLLTHCR